jgi:hypothetical protein
MSLRMTTLPPTALRARVVNYARRAYNVYIERVIVKTSWADCIGNQKF